jgi:hypothetical protein
MKSRRRILLFGLAVLLLLAVSVGVAVLWPAPSEAELAAAEIEVEMVLNDWQRAVARPSGCELTTDPDFIHHHWRYHDGSTLSLTLDPAWKISSVGTTPATQGLHPLIRFHPILVRVRSLLAK